ncbi:hypothetical protein BD770DRAFT_423599 [Pilaira anomala]|nr:hypothetical protein BD770DRAFT_423599 [Pilaira anomala]
MAGGFAMSGVAMTGVAMTGIAMTNTDSALVVVMMFLTLSNTHFRNIAICSLLGLESKRTKRLLNNSTWGHKTKMSTSTPPNALSDENTCRNVSTTKSPIR